MKVERLDWEDAEKLKRLYLKYRTFLACSARKILQEDALAEDAVHNTFEKLTGCLYKVDESDEHKSRRFLQKMCVNLAKTMLKKRTKLLRNADLLEEMDVAEDHGSDLLSAYVNKETLGAVIREVKSMEDKYQSVFFMKCNDEFSYEEIADRLEMDPAAVRKRMQRIRSRLITVAKEEALK
ncbi:MAG: sigma-70 family RNA polymerase sigma factor [Clostridia bacterium]|nr:sigma-70 family RNA polymerase sigma factor [Clostridia bacterium]